MSDHTFLNPAGLLPGQGFSHVAVPADGRTLYIAGQTAHQADGSVQGTSMAEQADAALANLVTALEAAGAKPSDLVAMQIYVTSVQAYRDDMDDIGRAWRKHLGKQYPAVSLFGIAELFDPAARIEVVARAVISEPPAERT